MADLSPDQIRVLITDLEELCRQAQELQKKLHQQMIERMRRDQFLERRGQIERRKKPR